jgi:mono/diheme cytochrome c family protein
VFRVSGGGGPAPEAVGDGVADAQAARAKPRRQQAARRRDGGMEVAEAGACGGMKGSREVYPQPSTAMRRSRWYDGRPVDQEGVMRRSQPVGSVRSATTWRAARARVRAVARLGAAAAWLALAVSGKAVLAQEFEQGRTLYETRCGACHERSVHRRESRSAKDFEGLRAEVARWSATSGGEWRAEEIDAVTAYLNDRYYRYPCPATVCRAQTRAHAGRR